ncbi:MAG: hypothetical protein ACYDAG_01895 [Chloroflexota bacterium]
MDAASLTLIGTLLGATIGVTGGLGIAFIQQRGTRHIARDSARREWRQQHVRAFHERINRRIGEYAVLSLMVKAGQIERVKQLLLSFVDTELLLRDYPAGLPDTGGALTQLGEAEQEMFAIGKRVLRLETTFSRLLFAGMFLRSRLRELWELRKTVRPSEALPLARSYYHAVWDEWHQQTLMPMSKARAAIEALNAAIEKYVDV